MSRETILQRMDEAAREDRERFFKVADVMRFQPKYDHAEVEAVVQQWRDIPQSEDYPNMNWPPKLPEWFPKINFASSWEKDLYLEIMLEQEKLEEKL